MDVPIRADSEHGLTPAQFAAMPARLRKRAQGDNPEAQRLLADIPVWEAAAKQLQGKSGRYSIVWSKVRRGSMKESGDDVSVAEAEQALEVAIAEIGARNSKADLSTIQAAHDAMVKLGAACGGDHGEKGMDKAPAPVKESLIEMDGGQPEPIRFNESGWGGVEYVTIAEAGPEWDDARREVWITPIRPGPGNKRDGFYYPERTIKEAVEAGRFNNIKMYANHPTKTQERELPERDVRDWVGVIKETVWDSTGNRPRSRVKVLDDATYSKWKEAPEHVAYSVIGGGRARRGTVNNNPFRIVESMDKVRSVDWVTEAGAGGAIDFAESADEEFDMELDNLTVEQVREGNPALFAAIREAEETADIAEDDKESAAANNAAATPEAAKAATPEKAKEDDDEAKERAAPTGTKSGGPAGKPAPDGYVSKEEFEALRAAFEASQSETRQMKAKEAAAEARNVAQDIVAQALSTSLLPLKGREYVASKFAEATVAVDTDEDLDLDYTFADEDEMVEAVAAEIELIRALTGGGSAVRGLGASEEDDDEDYTPSLRESKETDLLARIEENDDLPSARDAASVEGYDAKVADIASRI